MSRTAPNIKQRRLLSDLFKEGTEIRFGGKYGKAGKIGPFVEEATGRKIPLDEDTEVSMYVCPPDPVQREMSLRAANAKRAKALMLTKRDEESEEYLTAMAFLVDMDQETLIDYVLIGGIPSRRAEAEREVLALEEWKDMTALQDAMREYGEKSEEELALLQDDPEFKALMEADERYGDQIAERENQLEDAARDVLKMVAKSQGREELERKALERRSELVANQAYLHEYERQMRFYAVRDSDRIDLLFYESPEDLAAAPDQIQDLIMEALLPYISEEGEAKNSPGAASGSESSEPPKKPETSESSTPEEQTA